MAITTEMIKEYLGEKSVKYLYDSDKEVFIISFSPNVVLLRLEENGEFLQFRTLNFYQYKDGKYKNEIFKLLLSANYQRKMIKFGYDVDDGEINCCVDLPIEDSSITSTQLFRCLAALLEALNETRVRLTTLQETGKDPGIQKKSRIDQLIEEIMKEPSDKDKSKEAKIEETPEEDHNENEKDSDEHESQE